MPIIGTVGSRSRKTRFVYGAIYAVLALGAVTMVYPLLLMLSGSVKSEADAHLISPVPEFWFDDTMLFRKYAESKHNARLDACRNAWGRPVRGWRSIGEPAAVDPAVLEDFRAWRETPEARTIGLLGHLTGGRLFPRNARAYRNELIARYGGDIALFREQTGSFATGWSSVEPPVELVGRFRNQATPLPIRETFRTFKEGAPAEDLFFPLPQTDSVDDLRDRVRLSYVRISPAASAAYSEFLRARYGTPAVYGAARGLHYESFEDIPLPAEIDAQPWARPDWEAFLRDRTACRDEWISRWGPEERFAAFRAANGADAADLAAMPPFGDIVARCDWEDCLRAKSALRREFTLRNYRQVLDYVAFHGNGIRNTVIYCLLAVLTALLVNPLAAYALSRFRLPETYRLLLFFMATMAFPAEVSMIPSFILIKAFPLWPIAIGTASLILAHIALIRLAPGLSRRRRLAVSFAAGLLTGGVVAPLWLGPDLSTTSLLNTFAALILPGAASGYSIFLLKGFFDSLPQELYEAADLDGAGEWTKFWMLTMNLSKPILAVIALHAFTAAYGAFMMALIIVPDESMWTLMVWIFQLQSTAHGAVVYASLVLAAIPTFLIFAFCQNIIIRGIVVPTEK